MGSSQMTEEFKLTFKQFEKIMFVLKKHDQEIDAIKKILRDLTYDVHAATPRKKLY